jgi:hypothetical protein
MSSIAPWGSRMVPPPNVPTSRDGMETEIWRAPLRLRSAKVSKVQMSREAGCKAAMALTFS